MDLSLLLQAFVTGGLLGFALGPIGLWAVFMRMRGDARGAYKIVLGGAIVDTIVAVTLFFLPNILGGEGSWLSTFASQPMVRGVVMIAVGCLLLFLTSSNDPVAMSSRFGPFVAAALNSLEPTNFATMASAAAYFGTAADGSLTVLAALLAGIWVSWAGVIEGLARLRHRRVGHIMGVIVRSACIASIIWGVGLVVYAFF